MKGDQLVVFDIAHEIVVERLRQIDHEGFDAGHDDQHDDLSIACAAAVYVTPYEIFDRFGNSVWPWDPEWDKRDKHDRRKQLIIAAALIVAEIERLDRTLERRSK